MFLIYFKFLQYRLWRKNRTPNAGSSCEGTDLNRNYPFQWMVVGASKDPCSETYGGVSAGSELETKAVQKAINANLGKWETFISLHSYGKFMKKNKTIMAKADVFFIDIYDLYSR